MILDGQHKIGNGIEIRANNVSVENMTVRDFDRRPGGSTGGNQIFWNGGLGSGHVGMHGWRGRFLTVYDTGISGAHGIVIANAFGGRLDDVYASGFGGSGVLIEACRDCRAVIEHVTAENNAVGFSAANAGGHLILQRSTFRANSVGIAPVSLNTAALPAPQDGSCYSVINRASRPSVTSTRLGRCTIIRENLVVANDNVTVPVSAAVGPRLWGVGIAASGVYADLMQGNFVQGNANFGILAFEAPDPFPLSTSSVRFQVAGNRFSANTTTGNGVLTGGADLALEGGSYARGSVNDCFSENRFATSIPAAIETAWGCQNAKTPLGASSLTPRIIALESASPTRRAAPQPSPGAQTTLSHPCVGPPPSLACG